MCEYFQGGYQKLVIHKEILRMRMCNIPGGRGGRVSWTEESNWSTYDEPTEKPYQIL
jgi:hypothetical protein